MTLTPEQKARMEANRAKALRAQQVKKMASQTSKPPDPRPLPVPAAKPLLSKQPAQSFYSSVPKCTGKCVLLPGGDRFSVLVGFHDALIAVFRTVSSSGYDAKTRVWSFHLRDHEELMKKVLFEKDVYHV